jgi:hypothetical protein
MCSSLLASLDIMEIQRADVFCDLGLTWLNCDTNKQSTEESEGVARATPNSLLYEYITSIINQCDTTKCTILYFIRVIFYITPICFGSISRHLQGADTKVSTKTHTHITSFHSMQSNLAAVFNTFVNL